MLMCPPTVKFGSTRIVFLIGKLAIKVPNFTSWYLFLQGLLANRQERIFSRTGWVQLCPIIASVPGGWIIVMKRAKVLTEDEFYKYKGIIKFLTTKKTYSIPAEMKPDSFGWLNGKLVVVDYGN